MSVINGTLNTRIEKFEELMSPESLMTELPKFDNQIQVVKEGRQTIENILDGKDSRFLAIVGPCSIHDEDATIEYAHLLSSLSKQVKDRMVVVMRAYFEKPRTSIGWKGLINDPDLNGTYDITKGLRLSRSILLQCLDLGIPCATEYLETFTPQYQADLISWAAIGARTTEAPPYRQLASGLSMPVGFKNGTSGDIDIAVNAILAAREKQRFMGISEEGKVACVTTMGNLYSHVVLRGGKTPNYQVEYVLETQRRLGEQGLPPVVVVDCSHGNSNKDYRNQTTVFEDVLRQRVDGNCGVLGVMVESNLVEGKQPIPPNLIGFDSSTLRQGVSITDGCINMDTTRRLLLEAYAHLGSSRVYVNPRTAQSLPTAL